MTTRAPKCVPLLLVVALTACGDEPLMVRQQEADAATAPQMSIAGSLANHDAMQHVVNTFDQAWTAGDAVAYAAQYAGAEWVGPTGVILTDPAAITGTYDFILTALLPGTIRQSTIRDLTFLTGTIAVLDIDARVTGFSSLPPGLVPWQPGMLRALEKNILVKRGGEWRIVQHQQTFVAPEP